MKNTPYVKQYEGGVWFNPIQGQYFNFYPNRKARRGNSDGRLHNNKKGIQVVVTKIGPTSIVKTYKRLQVICRKFIKDKEGKVIGSVSITPKHITHNG